MELEIGKQRDDRSAIEPFGCVVQLVFIGCRRRTDTQVRRRVLSKPADRIGEGGHEESKTDR